jgi:hypothetical protein
LTKEGAAKSPDFELDSPPHNLAPIFAHRPRVLLIVEFHNPTIGKVAVGHVNTGAFYAFGFGGG